MTDPAAWNPTASELEYLERKWALKYGEPGWYPNAINPKTGLPRTRAEEFPLADQDLDTSSKE